MSLLFEPLTIRGVTFPNRIFLAPMCQYSADLQDGMPTDWHLVHLGSHAIGGYGLILTEAASVSPEGRISPEDVGLWNIDQQHAWARINAFLHAQGAATGVQLAHAGRKASTYSPFAGPSGSVPAEQGGWTTVAPSAQAFGNYREPVALTTAQIAAVVQDFAAAAARADSAGFDVVEIHAAHGYLVHQFLSPLSNLRTDEYGGDFVGRSRLLAEIVTAVRQAWPDHKPLFVRFSGTDWTQGGWSIEETAQAAALVATLGADFIDVSSGGNVPSADIPIGPGYQVPLAAAVRTSTGLPTGAVGWPLRAAHELGLPADKSPYRPQYERGAWR
jgi:2,4-dienoyl-CoA reductase-like NADH-dependent reductase (Old Yellow Enzyme family)